MSIFSELASRTDVLFRSGSARVVELDGHYEVMRPSGLPVRVKRGNLWQKRFPTREIALDVMAEWYQRYGAKVWKETTGGSEWK